MWILKECYILKKSDGKDPRLRIPDLALGEKYLKDSNIAARIEIICFVLRGFQQISNVEIIDGVAPD